MNRNTLPRSAFRIVRASSREIVDPAAWSASWAPGRKTACPVAAADDVFDMRHRDYPTYAHLEWIAIEAGHCATDSLDVGRFTCECGWQTPGVDSLWLVDVELIDRHMYASAADALAAAGKLDPAAIVVFVELATSQWHGTLEEMITAAEGVSA